MHKHIFVEILKIEVFIQISIGPLAVIAPGREYGLKSPPQENHRFINARHNTGHEFATGLLTPDCGCKALR